MLSEYDPGYYGQGIYLALEAEYSIEQYGLHPQRGANKGESDSVPLLVCGALVGNVFPIVEMPSSEHGYMGKPIVAKADAHVALVAMGIDATQPAKEPWWYPCRPEKLKDGTRSYTEIVVREASHKYCSAI